jgi:hypothetical protein
MLTGWRRQDGLFSARPTIPPHSLWRRLRAVIGRLHPSPAYYFSDLSFQIARDGFHTPQAVRLSTPPLLNWSGGANSLPRFARRRSARSLILFWRTGDFLLSDGRRTFKAAICCSFPASRNWIPLPLHVERTYYVGPLTGSIQPGGCVPHWLAEELLTNLAVF